MATLNVGGNLSEVFGGTGADGQTGGRKMTVKAMKRLLKKAGLKTSGKKAALTRRVKKAHLKMRGGECKDGFDTDTNMACGGRRRRRTGRKH